MVYSCTNSHTIEIRILHTALIMYVVRVTECHLVRAAAQSSLYSWMLFIFSKGDPKAFSYSCFERLMATRANVVHLKLKVGR